MSWPQSDFGWLKREKENPAMDNWRCFLIFNAVKMGGMLRTCLDSRVDQRGAWAEVDSCVCFLQSLISADVSHVNITLLMLMSILGDQAS